MAAPEGTRAILILADYIGVDLGSKLNIIGAGFTLTAIQPGTNTTAPQYIAALIDFPSNTVGRQIPITLELRDETTGFAAVMPGPTGSSEALRVQQLAILQHPTIPGVTMPETLPCRHQSVLGFPNGLPLEPGHRYAWKLEIDGTKLKGWQAHFHVLAPPPQPVFGGPNGPSDIPAVDFPGEIEDEIDDSDVDPGPNGEAPSA